MLGIAYGLIAKHGDFFYTNFKPSLVRFDPEQEVAREQYEVDRARVLEAIHNCADPLTWFPC